jgi:hypothetical protein
MRRIPKIVWNILLLALFGMAGVASASVTVSPASASVKPGGEVQFSAAGSADGIVIWNISGAGCSGITCGQINSDGLYQAPATAPSPANIVVSATSLADVTEVGTASVTIGSAASVSVALSPDDVTLSVKGQQQFVATVKGSTNTSVTWAVSGIGCVAGSCGSISSTGLYTAPATIPNPALATVTATSAADSTKSASASIVIQSASAVSVTISPKTAQISAGGQQQFSATISGSTNTAVAWKVSGAGCSGVACGTISTSGLYTAPTSIPSPAAVTVTAASVADPGQTASASISIAAAPALAISPASPQVKPQGQVQFSASGPQSGVVVWSISGAGCSGIACGSINSSGLYTAPAAAPSPNTVTVKATSLANGAISGSTVVKIVAPTTVGVTVAPSDASLNAGAKQQFTATVTGSSNTAVTWGLSGTGCAGSLCGSITSAGLYTAPSTPPDPPFVTVTATSSADSSKSGSASVTVTENVGISISPTTANVGEGQMQQFTASVTGTANTGVTWSVSGTGCSGSGCGTVTSTGVYTAPSSIPTSVVVTATSSVDNSVSASAKVTVISPVVVTISPTSSIVAAGTQQQFRASVSGNKNTSITWTVSGSGCTGTACGTVSTAGLYTAPGSIPNPPMVTVKAASQADISSFASATVSLVATNNSKLTGQYAFFFTGYDSNGAYQAVGSFTANGKGQLTAGQEDVNNFVQPSTSVPLTGSYQVNSDNRGTLTLNSMLGTHTYKFALNALGNKGRFISFDQSDVRGSGVIELQDPAAFDPSALANGYVLGLSGEDAFGARVGALGLVFPDGAGFIAGSTLDVNDGGSVATTYVSFAGVYNVDATGRGTATLLIPGLGNGTFDFAFYVVSANEFLMISIDPLNQNSLLFGGPAKIQNGAPFAPSSFNGGAIVSMIGMDGSSPQALAGRFNFDGDAGISLNFDENDGGKVTVAGLMTGAYDLELNGRGTLNLDNPANGGSTIWYMYATGPNQGFIMDASTGAASIGEITAETTVPPFMNSDILGTYSFGAGDPIVQSSTLSSGVSSFDGGSSIRGQGMMSGAEDTSQASSLSLNQVLAGTYSVSGVSNNGRGTILLTSPSAGTIAVWVARPSQYVGLRIDSTITQPVILYFEQ